MEIAQYQRQQTLTGSAGNVIARQPNSFGELENLGNTLTQLGMEVEKQRLDAQYYDQINSAKLQVDKKFLDFQDNLNPDNTDQWLDKLDSFQQSYEPEILSKITNERARAYAGPMLEEEKFRQRKSISDYRAVVEARNAQQRYYINYKESADIASKQQTPGDFDQYVLSFLKSQFGLQLNEDAKNQLREGKAGTEIIKPENLESVENYANPMFHTEKLRKDQAKAWISDAKDLFDKDMLDRYIQTQLNEALRRPDGLEYINGLDMPVDAKKELVSDYNFENNLRKGRQKQIGEAFEAEISGDILKSTNPNDPQKLSYEQIRKKIIEGGANGMLDGTQIRELTRFLDSNSKNAGKEPDQIERGQARNEIYDAITKGDKKKALSLWRDKAWMFTAAKNDQINDDIRNIGNNEHFLNDPIYKFYDNAIYNLMIGEPEKQGVKPEQDPEMLRQYTQLQENFTEWWRNHQDATVQQRADYYKELTKPYVEKNVKSWLGRLLSIFDTSMSIRELSKGGSPGRSIKQMIADKNKSQNITINEALLNAEPQDYDGFRFEVQRMAANDKELAKQYYEKRKYKWATP
jgi:hypothetical protein